MKFYVYILYRPDGRPFYVGKGQGSRWQDHAKASTMNGLRNPHKRNVIRKILRDGKRPECRIIAKFDDEIEAYKLETLLIKQIGRRQNGGPLTNLTDGGGGSAGVLYTAERNAKVSTAMKGRPKSPEHKAKISATLKAKLDATELERLRNMASKGGSRIQSEEEKAKRRKPRQFTPEHLANLREALARRPSRKGIPKTEETKAKMKAAMARRKQENPGSMIRQKDPATGRFLPKESYR